MVGAGSGASMGAKNVVGHDWGVPIVGNTANYLLKSRDRLALFGRFLFSYWVLAHEGPFPANFTQFRSLYLCLR